MEFIFLLCSFSYSFSYIVMDYTVDFKVGRDGILDVREVLNVNFTTPLHGIYRKISITQPGTIVSFLRIFDVSVLDKPVSVSNTDYATEIRMGDPNEYVIGYQTYNLSYRMSPPIFRDVFSLNLIESAWDSPLNNITFSITFPKPFDPSTIQVLSGASDTTSLENNCSYETLDRTIVGECSTLWQSALTVAVPINRVYFIPTTAQLCVLIISFLLLLFLSIYLIHFFCVFKHANTNQPLSLTPTQASQLLFGKVATQIELLYLASQGQVQFTGTPGSDLTLTFVESSFQSRGSVLNSHLILSQSYSGEDLRNILLSYEVSHGAQEVLRAKGYISRNRCVCLWWLVFVIPPAFAVTELACAYQTVGGAVGFGILETFVAGIYGVTFCECCSGYYSIRLGTVVITAFVFWMMSIGVGFAFYFDRPILWDTFQGIILGGLVSALIEYGFVFRLNWTTAGIRAAAGILAYRRKIMTEGIPEGCDESEVWLTMAYMCGLRMQPPSLGMEPWFDWAIHDSALWRNGSNGDAGSGDWGGGGGDCGGGGGDCGGGGGDCGGGGGGGGGGWLYH
jgi:uncharacterized membrane protein YgcG